MVFRKLVILAFLLTSFFAKAQTFDEFFKQKETQRKYLAEQIAAFQLYLGYIKKGITITNNGLNLVHDLKNGEFNLHSDYFNSLKNVNPRIKQYARVADIISLEKSILNTYKKIKAIVSFQKLVDATADNIEELTILLTNGKLEMSDKDRMQRIDHIYDDMSAKYLFIISASDKIQINALQNQRDLKDIQTLQKIY